MVVIAFAVSSFMHSLEKIFEDWLVEEHRLGRLHRASSHAVYRAMWGALTAWCLARTPPIRDVAQLTPDELATYIRSREQGAHDGQTLTPRYEWRLLSLVRRVQAWAAQVPPTHTAAEALLTRRPHVRLANVQRSAEHAEYLQPQEVTALLRSFAIQHRLASMGALQRWQDLRNVTAAALQLGAGLGPGDVRALTCRDAAPPDAARQAVSATLGAWPDRTPGTPRPVRGAADNRPTGQWIRVPANGNAPTHLAPLADWAARLLQAWLRLRQQLAIPGDWLLPSTRTGKPWGKVAQYQAGCEVLAAAGIASQAAGGSFRLRHSFAMRQLRRGHATDTVAAWLGVSDPAVMQRYLRQLDAGEQPLATTPPPRDLD